MGCGTKREFFSYRLSPLIKLQCPPERSQGPPTAIAMPRPYIPSSRLDLTFYPYLPAATVGATDPRAYLGLIASAGIIRASAGVSA